MSLMQGIVALVKADSGMNAAIGGRIMPVTLPENTTLPAATYQVVGGVSYPTFDTSGMQKVRVQFDFRAAIYGDAEAARGALISLLNGYRGTLPNGVFLESGDLIQSLDFFDYEPRQYRCSVEFYLYFNLGS